MEHETAKTNIADIPDLCRRFLALTEAPERQRAWTRERHACRRLLRQSGRPGYFATADAEYDLDWIADLLPEVLPAAEEAGERWGEPIHASEFFSFAATLARAGAHRSRHSRG